MSDKDIKNLKEMLVDFNEYSTDYTKTRCKELEKTIKNTLEEIEILNTNLEVANEDLTRIAQLLDLEEGCTIYDIEDKIERLNNIINELEKYLEEIKDRVIMYGIDDDTYKTTNLYRDIKNKIKELKGSGKE